MRALSPDVLIEVWEDGMRLHAVDRALLVLSRVCPERDHHTLAGMTVGRRDAMLLAVRRQLFGDRIEASTSCPVCREALELSLSCESLLNGVVEQDEVLEAGFADRMAIGGYELGLRAPNSCDLAMAAGCRNAEEAAALLFDRLVTVLSPPSDPLPPEVRLAATERISELDPHAEIRLDLRCPGCGHRWPDLLDVVSFVWAEISSRAHRLLQEVHALARAYRWHERDILRMSPERRAMYLQLAGS